MVEEVVKAKVGEMEEEIRERFLRRLMKEMTGVVQEVVGRRRYLVMLHNGLEKDMLLNQIIVMVFRNEVEDEIEVRKVEIFPEVREELGCYYWVYIYLYFIKEDGLENSEEMVGVETDPDEDYMNNVVLNDDRERHWRICFEDNN